MASQPPADRLADPSACARRPRPSTGPLGGALGGDRRRDLGAGRVGEIDEGAASPVPVPR